MHEYIFGLWKGTRGKTLSKNWTECLHSPEETRARGEIRILGELALSRCLSGVHHKEVFLCPYMTPPLLGRREIEVALLAGVHRLPKP